MSEPFSVDFRQRRRDRAVGLAGDEVQRAGGGRAEGRAERVVAHREVLRVVPQRRHGVAVVVAHRQRLVGAVARELREAVHQPAVERLLLGRVVVVLVADDRFRAVDPERVERVRVFGQQVFGQPVHAGRVRRGVERGLAGRVGGVGVGPEVVIERDVLLEDDDQVLDRGRRSGARAWRWPERGRACPSSPADRRPRGVDCATESSCVRLNTSRGVGRRPALSAILRRAGSPRVTLA